MKKKNKVKNYTSQVDASTSIGKIERTLMRMGANRIVKDYDRENDCITAIMFEMQIAENSVTFRLPAKVDACFKVINSYRVRKTSEGEEKDMAQAERTAWKIIYDWVESQAALIELDQAEVAEVFLPYAYSPSKGKTLYEVAIERGVNQLLLT